MPQHNVLRTPTGEKHAVLSEKYTAIDKTSSPQNVLVINRRTIKPVENKHTIISTGKPLQIRSVRMALVEKWKERGIPMAYLAKEYKVSIARIEATVWSVVTGRLLQLVTAVALAAVVMQAAGE